jgi:hypothetical protein
MNYSYESITYNFKLIVTCPGWLINDRLTLVDDGLQVLQVLQVVQVKLRRAQGTE